MIYNRSLKDDYLNELNYRKSTSYIPFLLGRNAINYLADTLQMDNIILPYYICPMVIKIFKNKHINIYYYEQFDNNLAILEEDIIKILEQKIIGKTYFLWNDYLGITGDIPNKIYDVLNQQNIIPLIDAIHTLPIKTYQSNIVIYGFRKLLNESFGALLKFDNYNHSNEEELNYLKKLYYKIGFFIKNITLQNKLNYFNKFDFDSNENLLYDNFKCDEIKSKHLKLDYKIICKKRKDNFMFYHSQLSNKIDINFDNIECPYGYPLMVDDNRKYRQKLWDNDIHSFILWGELYEEKENIKQFKYVQKLRNSNLILPVNQDLTMENLKTIIRIIKS